MNATQAELEKQHDLKRGLVFRRFIHTGENGCEILIRKYRIARLYPHIVLTKTVGLKTNYNVCFQYWEINRILGRIKTDKARVDIKQNVGTTF